MIPLRRLVRSAVVSAVRGCTAAPARGGVEAERHPPVGEAGNGEGARPVALSAQTGPSRLGVGHALELRGVVLGVDLRRVDAEQSYRVRAAVGESNVDGVP